jgi:hypothetical protein
VATLALAENPNGYVMGAGYHLPASPVRLIKLLAQQSGCFRVVDRNAGLRGTIQEQDLKEVGRAAAELHRGQGQGLRGAVHLDAQPHVQRAGCGAGLGGRDGHDSGTA